MNYLELVNRARRECGVSGPALTTLGGTLSYEAQRFKDWIEDAWNDVQTARTDWWWMRTTGANFNTQNQVPQYSLTTMAVPNLNEYVRDSARCYTTSVGFADMQILPFMEWQTFRNVYRFGNMMTTYSRPVVFSVAPDHSLFLGPAPDATVYTITYDFWRVPTELTFDTAAPDDLDKGLPERWHMLLVYRAMMAYGSFESAPEVHERGAREYRRLMQHLMTWGIPTITSGPPLA